MTSVPSVDTVKTMSEASGEARRHLAGVLRAILEQAEFQADDDIESIIARLTQAMQAFFAACDGNEEIIFGEENVLGEAYIFVAAMKKTLDQSHPARPLSHRSMSREEFQADVRARLPHFRQGIESLRVKLIQTFPSC